MTHAATRGFLVLAMTTAIAACGESPQAPAAASPAVDVPAVVAPAFAAYSAGDAAEAGNCSLDAINGAAAQGASLATGSEAMFSGWVADAQAAVPADAQLVLRGASAYAVPLAAGGERADVAAALNSEAARLSGFNVGARLEGVEPGEYALSIAHAGNSARCDLKATVVVTRG